jgi:flavin reductase (DIM6/NTAB) family NADH-FMN oxidoreductase RutF
MANSDPAKEILRRFPYGWYLLTSRTEEDENAMVVNWIMQASFEPRLIAVGLQKTSYSYNLVREGGVFSVNLFLQEDEALVKPFAKGRAKKPDKMETAAYTRSPETGCPIIEGAAAYVECEVLDIFDTGGDHDLVLGEVVAARTMKKGEVEDTLNLPEVGWSYAG